MAYKYSEFYGFMQIFVVNTYAPHPTKNNKAAPSRDEAAFFALTFVG